MNDHLWRGRPSTIATELSGRHQYRVAIAVCLIAFIGTVGVLPFVARAAPAFSGFVLINQTALIVAYALSAWVLFAQFKRGRSLPLLIVAGGTLYTGAIVFLQLLSFPGVVTGGRLLGHGPETTTWLWSFWHIGPPVCAFAYALATHGDDSTVVMPRHLYPAAAGAIVIALMTAGLACLVATYALLWLPHQVTGDDYAALTTSGVGPAILALTVAALSIVWWRTRGHRSVLELWIVVALVLLILDNIVTLAGGARATIGWYVGRLEALVSAFAILWAYLYEVGALHLRAEQSAADLLRAEVALRQAQKMEAIGRLTGGVAHDFNNLLTIVNSGLEMIRRRPDDRARVLKMADAGLEAVQRGSRLTKQLLSFTRRESFNPETVNANASLLDFEPLARRALGEAIDLTLALNPALHPAQIDRGEFESAMLNLIVNARDAVSAQGGQIKISTRNATLPPSATHDRFEALASGEYVVIAVSDNGAGMDEATRAQVFEPFFTTKEFGKGSGLGLSQVYGFARGTGGAVQIASVLGEGTTVELWLPRADPMQSVAVQSVLKDNNGPASQLRRAEQGETILAVEDEPAVLAAVTENLKELGYRVLQAHDAQAALALLRVEERIDILFSDVVMPGGMNGLQLAVEAARVRPGIRALLTSGYTDEALSGEHSMPENLRILTKPYRREELAERLKIAGVP